MSIALALIAGCTTYTHTERLEATELLPEIDAECTESTSDVIWEDGARVVSQIAPVDGGCRASVVASEPLVRWGKVRRDIDKSAPDRAKIVWTRVTPSFDRIAVTTIDDELPPAGATIAMAQLLSGPSSPNHGDLSEAPLAWADALSDGLQDRPEHLASLAWTMDGASGPNLAGEIDPITSDLGPAEVIDVSFDSDDVLTMTTIAEVVVPNEALEALGAAQLVLDLDESVDFVSGISYCFVGKCGE